MCIPLLGATGPDILTKISKETSQRFVDKDVFLMQISASPGYSSPKRFKITSGQEIRWNFEPPLNPEEKITVLLALSEKPLRRLVA